MDGPVGNGLWVCLHVIGEVPPVRPAQAAGLALGDATPLKQRNRLLFYGRCIRVCKLSEQEKDLARKVTASKNMLFTLFLSVRQCRSSVKLLAYEILAMVMSEPTDNSRQAQIQVRIDKWLWAARFFKTRALAAQAVGGGKVQVNGNRAKSSRIVQVGDTLRVRRGEVEFTMVVLGLSGSRGPATVARLLYAETEESVRLRLEAAQMRSLLAAGQAAPVKRPDKRDRRKIREFTRKDEDT
jgi:ribosome-associated heat shock protein Hsp15